MEPHLISSLDKRVHDRYMITYSEIPHFGWCYNNGEGFVSSPGTGDMQENATMEMEQSVSDFWRGPNIDLHGFIGQVHLLGDDDHRDIG